MPEGILGDEASDFEDVPADILVDESWKKCFAFKATHEEPIHLKEAAGTSCCLRRASRLEHTEGKRS